jgi:outer membrane protein assembly factor BamE (lipoprotein component of BamABCDE complex)
MMLRKRSMVMLGTVLLALAALALTGCISGRSDVTYGPKGPAVGRDTLRQIKVGETSREWLLGTLGEPTRTARTPEGTEVLTYVYTKKIDSDFDVFLVLDIDEKREERTVYTFEVNDGVVTNYWKER